MRDIIQDKRFALPSLLYKPNRRRDPPATAPGQLHIVRAHAPLVIIQSSKSKRPLWLVNIRRCTIVSVLPQKVSPISLFISHFYFYTRADKYTLFVTVHVLVRYSNLRPPSQGLPPILPLGKLNSSIWFLGTRFLLRHCSLQFQSHLLPLRIIINTSSLFDMPWWSINIIFNEVVLVIWCILD